jgi:hypothetical protein
MRKLRLTDILDVNHAILATLVGNALTRLISFVLQSNELALKNPSMGFSGSTTFIAIAFFLEKGDSLMSCA